MKRGTLRPRFAVDPSSETMQWGLVATLAATLCLGIGALVTLGYVATREWRDGAQQLVEHEAAETLALAASALGRDMHGAWMLYLTQINRATIDEEPPLALLQLTARAFARFPYIDSLIVLRAKANAQPFTYVFSRSDHPPPWFSGDANTSPFPVALQRNPPALAALADQLQRVESDEDRPFVVINDVIAGISYQIVAHRFFSVEGSRDLHGVAAFTIDLGWVQRNYFGPLLQQIAQMGGATNPVTLDVTSSPEPQALTQPPDRPVLQKRFPLVFMDPVLLSSPERARLADWTLRVHPRRDPALTSSARGATVTFVVMIVAALASVVALLLTIRALRAHALLGATRAEFISAVTHELKTPLALIQLVGETLARGRYTSSDKVKEYATLLSLEAGKLGEGINNLLAFARYNSRDREAIAHFRAETVCDLVDDALSHYRTLIEERGFRLAVDVPSDLAPVSVDRVAMTHAIQNVIDNAIKYSGDARSLSIVARADEAQVTLAIEDRGIGIPAADLHHVFEQFYRGKNVTGPGSGLGLAIVHRVLAFHCGTTRVRSALGQGTSIELVLPRADRQ